MGALSRRWGTRGERPKAARRTMPLVSLSRFASMARAVYRGRGSEASCLAALFHVMNRHVSTAAQRRKQRNLRILGTATRLPPLDFSAQARCALWRCGLSAFVKWLNYSCNSRNGS